jgi:chaperone modulatory protein CbpM
MNNSPYALSADELSRTCAVQVQFIVELVQEGVLTPIAGTDPVSWRFDASGAGRIKVAWRLHRDLGVNLPGAALALDLMDALDQLRAERPRDRA